MTSKKTKTPFGDSDLLRNKGSSDTMLDPIASHTHCCAIGFDEVIRQVSTIKDELGDIATHTMVNALNQLKYIQAIKSRSELKKSDAVIASQPWNVSPTTSFISDRSDAQRKTVSSEFKKPYRKHSVDVFASDSKPPAITSLRPDAERGDTKHEDGLRQAGVDIMKRSTSGTSEDGFLLELPGCSEPAGTCGNYKPEERRHSRVVSLKNIPGDDFFDPLTQYVSRNVTNFKKNLGERDLAMQRAIPEQEVQLEESLSEPSGLTSVQRLSEDEFAAFANTSEFNKSVNITSDEDVIPKYVSEEDFPQVLSPEDDEGGILDTKGSEAILAIDMSEDDFPDVASVASEGASGDEKENGGVVSIKMSEETTTIYKRTSPLSPQMQEPIESQLYNEGESKEPVKSRKEELEELPSRDEKHEETLISHQEEPKETLSSCKEDYKEPITSHKKESAEPISSQTEGHIQSLPSPKDEAKDEAGVKEPVQNKATMQPISALSKEPVRKVKSKETVTSQPESSSADVDKSITKQPEQPTVRMLNTENMKNKQHYFMNITPKETNSIIKFTIDTRLGKKKVKCNFSGNVTINIDAGEDEKTKKDSKKSKLKMLVLSNTENTKIEKGRRRKVSFEDQIGKGIWKENRKVIVYVLLTNNYSIPFSYLLKLKEDSYFRNKARLLEVKTKNEKRYRNKPLHSTPLHEKHLASSTAYILQVMNIIIYATTCFGPTDAMECVENCAVGFNSFHYQDETTNVYPEASQFVSYNKLARASDEEMLKFLSLHRFPEFYERISDNNNFQIMPIEEQQSGQKRRPSRYFNDSEDEGNIQINLIGASSDTVTVAKREESEHGKNYNVFEIVIPNKQTDKEKKKDTIPADNESAEYRLYKKSYGESRDLSASRAAGQSKVSKSSERRKSIIFSGKDIIHDFEAESIVTDETHYLKHGSVNAVDNSEDAAVPYRNGETIDLQPSSGSKFTEGVLPLNDAEQIDSKFDPESDNYIFAADSRFPSPFADQSGRPLPDVNQRLDVGMFDTATDVAPEFADITDAKYQVGKTITSLSKKTDANQPALEKIKPEREAIGKGLQAISEKIQPEPGELRPYKEPEDHDRLVPTISDRNLSKDPEVTEQKGDKYDESKYSPYDSRLPAHEEEPAKPAGDKYSAHGSNTLTPSYISREKCPDKSAETESRHSPQGSTIPTSSYFPHEEQPRKPAKGKYSPQGSPTPSRLTRENVPERPAEGKGTYSPHGSPTSSYISRERPLGKPAEGKYSPQGSPAQSRLTREDLPERPAEDKGKYSPYGSLTSSYISRERPLGKPVEGKYSPQGSPTSSRLTREDQPERPVEGKYSSHGSPTPSHLTREEQHVEPAYMPSYSTPLRSRLTSREQSEKIPEGKYSPQGTIFDLGVEEQPLIHIEKTSSPQDSLPRSFGKQSIEDYDGKYTQNGRISPLSEEPQTKSLPADKQPLIQPTDDLKMTNRRDDQFPIQRLPDKADTETVQSFETPEKYEDKHTADKYKSIKARWPQKLPELSSSAESSVDKPSVSQKEPDTIKPKFSSGEPLSVKANSLTEDSALKPALEDAFSKRTFTPYIEGGKYGKKTDIYGLDAEVEDSWSSNRTEGKDESSPSKRSWLSTEENVTPVVEPPFIKTVKEDDPSTRRVVFYDGTSPNRNDTESSLLKLSEGPKEFKAFDKMHDKIKDFKNNLPTERPDAKFMVYSGHIGESSPFLHKSEFNGSPVDSDNNHRSFESSDFPPVRRGIYRRDMPQSVYNEFPYANDALVYAGEVDQQSPFAYEEYLHERESNLSYETNPSYSERRRSMYGQQQDRSASQQREPSYARQQQNRTYTLQREPTYAQQQHDVNRSQQVSPTRGQQQGPNYSQQWGTGYDGPSGPSLSQRQQTPVDKDTRNVSFKRSPGTAINEYQLALPIKQKYGGEQSKKPAKAIVILVKAKHLLSSKGDDNVIKGSSPNGRELDGKRDKGGEGFRPNKSDMETATEGNYDPGLVDDDETVFSTQGTQTFSRDKDFETPKQSDKEAKRSVEDTEKGSRTPHPRISGSPDASLLVHTSTQTFDKTKSSRDETTSMSDKDRKRSKGDSINGTRATRTMYPSLSELPERTELLRDEATSMTGKDKKPSKGDSIYRTRKTSRGSSDVTKRTGSLYREETPLRKSDEDKNRSSPDSSGSPTSWSPPEKSRKEKRPKYSRDSYGSKRDRFTSSTDDKDVSKWAVDKRKKSNPKPRVVIKEIPEFELVASAALSKQPMDDQPIQPTFHKGELACSMNVHSDDFNGTCNFYLDPRLRKIVRKALIACVDKRK